MLRILLEGKKINESASTIDFKSKTSNVVLDLVNSIEDIIKGNVDMWVGVSLGKAVPQIMLLSPSTIKAWINNKGIMSKDEAKSGIATPNKTFNHPNGLDFLRDTPTKLIAFKNPKDGAKQIEKLFGKSGNTVTFVAVIDKSKGKAFTAGRGKQYRSKDMWIDDKNGCQINAEMIELTITKLMTGFYQYDGI